jgi:hypothetical protein
MVLIFFLCFCFVFLFSILYIQVLCIVFGIVFPFAYRCHFFTFVHVYRLLQQGKNQIAVNTSKYCTYSKYLLDFRMNPNTVKKNPPFLCHRIVYFTALYNSRNHKLIMSWSVVSSVNSVNLKKWFISVCSCHNASSSAHSHIIYTPCHHGMARPQVADGAMASNMEGSCEYIKK